MGRPLVTLPTNQLRGRITYALYKQIGVSACVARTAADYVNIAVAIGTQPELRERLGRMIQHASEPLFENDETVHELEQFFEQAVLPG